ncbi:N-acetylmuramoyl-L-alanine amidase [Caballeronia sp. LZ043]|uniref:N-acetylmuramoyl-L-alanine amidase n=1 Tax=Caballeronia sp. LZ043 TaxID=3038569 RepID=UPI002864BFAE|nr:N-acetylmuramoyl-L-alanine amidase [Caballeronia sp. LZ043]MDR5820440.1 N-acetylmuramoyl-L-alanine amidase [Caballeronia sp. LZ043]
MTLGKAIALAALFSISLLTACTPTHLDRGTYIADLTHPAKNADSRIRFLVMHYTEIDEAGSLAVLTGDQVSVHYVVPDAPRIEHGEPVVYQLVPEDKRAWHAGVSSWQGATELNASSIGIENVNLGPIGPTGPLSEGKWQPYPPAQVDALIQLSRDIVARYHIPPTRVVGHSDIAPQRKIDPGPLFPWRTLYDAGVGAWPDADAVAAHLAGRDPKAPSDVQPLQEKLKRYGYDVATDGVLDDRTRRVFSAFQMHFRPSDYAGNADAESDAIAQALLDKYFNH